MRTFRRVFAMDLPENQAVELTRKSMSDKGFKVVRHDAEVAEDFLGQKTRIVTVEVDA
ncbi:MAG: hypothetical protein ACRDK3_03635 [Actinomycetota bacterium]